MTERNVCYVAVRRMLILKLVVRQIVSVGGLTAVVVVWAYVSASSWSDRWRIAASSTSYEGVDTKAVNFVFVFVR